MGDHFVTVKIDSLLGQNRSTFDEYSVALYDKNGLSLTKVSCCGKELMDLILFYEKAGLQLTVDFANADSEENLTKQYECNLAIIVNEVLCNHSGVVLPFTLPLLKFLGKSGEVSNLNMRICALERENQRLTKVVGELVTTMSVMKDQMAALVGNSATPESPAAPIPSPAFVSTQLLEPAVPEETPIAMGLQREVSSESEGVSSEDEAVILTNNPDNVAMLSACLKLERESDELTRSLQPREVQLRFRSSAAAILRSHIQKALHCNAFDVSFCELKCFLPDDPIKLTVVLDKNSLSTWHKVLYDRLTIISEQQDVRGEKSQLTLQGLTPQDEELMCAIRDVRLTSDTNTFRVVGVIENLPFEIVANGRIDLCMLAFFEEVNNLVGNDHLLKRSVLLIRAWWYYETVSPQEKSPREYLPDFAIWLIVVSLFNQYHTSITTPLQAFYLFLTLCGQYDGTKQVFTLFGLKSYVEGGHHISIRYEEGSMLIPSKLFEKYFNVFNVQGANLTIEAGLLQQIKVDRCGFNIMNPFTFENMTLEKLSGRKISRIQSYFTTALEYLKATLQAGIPAGKRSSSLLQTLFPQTMRNVFASDSRRDTFVTELLTPRREEMEMLKSPRDVFSVEIGQLWHDILYCNFVLQGVVSESALLSLCIEVLTDKKVLPVGEVGKIVSDVTAIPHLSSQLREKFGGLKKFLERYPEIFVFSKDHPFNPNVVLKKSLTAEQFDMVEKGLLSLQNVFKPTPSAGNAGGNTKQQSSGGMMNQHSHQVPMTLANPPMKQKNKQQVMEHSKPQIPVIPLDISNVMAGNNQYGRQQSGHIGNDFGWRDRGVNSQTNDWNAAQSNDRFGRGYGFGESPGSMPEPPGLDRHPSGTSNEWFGLGDRSGSKDWNNNQLYRTNNDPRYNEFDAGRSSSSWLGTTPTNANKDPFPGLPQSRDNLFDNNNYLSSGFGQFGLQDSFKQQNNNQFGNFSSGNNNSNANNARNNNSGYYSVNPPNDEFNSKYSKPRDKFF